MTHQERNRRALDPARSVVVEACAGSGKTWLLVSRLLRLLLAGVRPGEILAITYTRKAAREIEERLRLWLRQLAVLREEEALDFLAERGLSSAEARALLPRAQGLLEAVFAADPPITITTFHGWFARILGGAPLASGLAGYRLADAEGPLLEEAWARFARECARKPEGTPARALIRLFGEVGQLRTRVLLQSFVSRRAEWHAYLHDGAATLEDALSQLRRDLEVGAPGDAIAAFFALPGLDEDLEGYTSLLEANTESDRRRASALRAGWAHGDGDVRFAAIRDAVLTKTGEPRVCKASAAQARRLGGEGELRLLALHGRLTECVQDACANRLEEHIFALNQDILTAACALLEALDAHKRERRVMDFTDLEWHADRLLSDPEQAPFLQARLDARYRQILLDEFQDTNPLQWRILVAWLDAYGEDGTPPRVFLVGDPKQSIYRFRRADYRIFMHAAGWLVERFGAERLANDRTFRNAPVVVDVVNALFGKETAFVGFRPQESVRKGLPGRVEVLPLAGDGPGEEAESSPVMDGPEALRDPLTTPPREEDNLKRREEARLLAGRIGEMVGRWAIHDQGDVRPARYGDILILTRRRGILPEYEQALRDAGIPYLSVSRGGLLKTLEAADLAALLRWLASPGDDLSLAHALRAPFFRVSDEDLLELAGRNEETWWLRLQALAEGEEKGSQALNRAARLLAGWREQAARLPVHDLLDRIYNEADVVARYEAVVPPAMMAGVRANLEAFIGLSLNQDGGRYPSLPRFIDELARLDGAGDEEAPDEGVIAAEGADGGRVRIMTIHGAKGLEAPIVWLIDGRHASARSDVDQVLLDWQPGESRPRHFSMITRKDERGRHREALFAAEERAREREDLNLLYVAITRAAQYFFVSGIAPGREGGGSSPWQRIGAALEALGATDGSWGSLPLVLERTQEVMEPGRVAPVEVCPPVAIGRYRQLDEAEGEGAAFGTAFHLCLERLTEGLDVDDLEPRALEVARSLLDRPDLAVFFDPSRHVWSGNEVEFIDEAGRVGRIDRLVDDGDSLWVLDYKTGDPDEILMDAYRAQLGRYRRVVSALWPGRTVRSALLMASGELRELG